MLRHKPEENFANNLLATDNMPYLLQDNLMQ